MNLRDHGVEWQGEDGLKLWLHPSSGFTKAKLAFNAADIVFQLRDDTDTTIVHVRSAFIIAEGYVLDYEGDSESPIIDYLSNRSAFDSVGNADRFALLDYGVLNTFIDAYNKTRLAEDKDDSKDDEQKKMLKSEEGGLTGQNKEDKQKQKPKPVSNTK